MNKKAKSIAYFGLLASLALILSYIEAMLPPIYSSVPGIKMGLPNIVVIFTLYKFGVKKACVISLVRVFAVALLFGNVMTLSYSLAGAILSLSLMAVFKKSSLFSVVGISVIGGVSHNLGQILVAIFVMQTLEIGYYMIVLAVSGTIAGVIIGIIGSILVKRFKSVIF